MTQKRLIYITFILTLLIFACSKDDNPVAPSSTDIEKFIGTWAGTYECSSFPGDTLIINKGTGDLDLLIALHVHSGIDPEFINGELTKVNVITIPEQIIAGFEGSGEITYSSQTLSLVQRGFGLTCNGSNYVKIE